MAFELIIFDLDGVLVDSERIANRVEAEYFTSIGVPMTEEAARERFKGKTADDVARAIEEALPSTLPAGWPYAWAMLTADAFVRELKAVEGVKSVLELIAHKRIPMAVASQSPPGRIGLSLFVTGLGAYFDGRTFSSTIVARPKPAPDLFLHVAATMGAAPSRCAVVEDSPSGVIAAIDAGMTAFGYAADEDAGKLASAGASVFTRMEDLPRLLFS